MNWDIVFGSELTMFTFRPKFKLTKFVQIFEDSVNVIKIVKFAGNATDLIHSKFTTLKLFAVAVYLLYFLKSGQFFTKK
jgi:hypothetical protein